jgi:hypothetical protein
VKSVLEDEQKEYEAEQAKLAAKREAQAEAQRKRDRQAVPLWTIWQADKRQLETGLQQKILKLATVSGACGIAGNLCR